MNLANFKKLASLLESKEYVLNDIGLIDGKMGLSINFYHLWRFTNDEEFLSIADTLLDEVFQKVDISMKVYFASGLSGIAYGIESLFEKKFVEGDPQVVLQEIDTFIVEISKGINISSYDFLTGYLGICHYLVKKISVQRLWQEEFYLDFKLAILSFIDAIFSCVQNSSTLFSEPTTIELYWNLPLLIQSLKDLHVLNIYNSKVDKTIAFVLEKCEELEIKTNYHRLVLTKSLLKISKIAKFEQTCIQLAKKFSIDIHRYLLEQEIGITNTRAQLQVEIVNIYDMLLFYNVNDNFSSEFKFWKEKVSTDIISERSFDVQTIPEFIKLTGFSDGFKGFYRIYKFLLD